MRAASEAVGITDRRGRERVFSVLFRHRSAICTNSGDNAGVRGFGHPLQNGQLPGSGRSLRSWLCGVPTGTMYVTTASATLLVSFRTM